MYDIEDQIKKNRRKLFSFVFLLSVVLFLFVTGGYYGYHYFHKTPVEKYFTEKKPFGVLFLVQNPEKKESSVTFVTVMTFFPATNRIGFFSFYPQTAFSEQEASVGRRLKNSRIEEVSKEISGIIDIPVPYYVKSNFERISRLVDLGEGVDYFSWEPLLIKGEQLPSGEFFLDGSMVPRLLSAPLKNESAPAIELFRHYTLFLNLWAQRIQKWKSLGNSAVLPLVYGEFETNLSIAEFGFLGQKIATDESWNPLFMEVPVKRRGDTFVMDADATALYLKNFKKKLTLAELPFADVSPRIEIRNGTRVNNLAKRYRRDFQRKGIVVVEFSNADRHDYEKSILLDISGNRYFFQRVMQSIGIQKAYSAIDKSLFTDMILILGKDYEKLKIE